MNTYIKNIIFSILVMSIACTQEICVKQVSLGLHMSQVYIIKNYEKINAYRKNTPETVNQIKINKSFIHNKIDKKIFDYIEWLEVDVTILNRSPYLFVSYGKTTNEGIEHFQTFNNQLLPLNIYLEHISKTYDKSLNIWLDVKNLTEKNYSRVLTAVTNIYKVNKLPITLYIESNNLSALIKLKEAGFKNIIAWIDFRNTTRVSIKENINVLKPNNLSCYYKSIDLVKKLYPDKKIFIWTNKIEREKNSLKRMRQLFNDGQVSMILLDLPILYGYYLR